jgi:2-dehydro-3-deoxyphosphooctonate aldolase (KDO 8-P synthase)
MTKAIKVGNVKIGSNNPLVLFAGPCIIETERQTFQTAKRLKELTAKVGMPLIFKASYDKANRTSIDSYRGPGLKKGLEILKGIKEKLDLSLLIDVHEEKDVIAVSKVADILQVPAFLCRQTDLILAIAKTGKAVNVKKGQFLAPWDVKNIIEKIASTGNKNILLTERGTTFGYNNLVVDLKSLPIMRSFGYPVIFDATHSAQLPGGKGKSTGGNRRYIPYLARAAVACGIDGLFLEVHPDPVKARSDGPNMMKLDTLSPFLKEVGKIDKIVR